ncbi:MAG: hypothetical protein HKO85_01600 [Xanthomonadales bacterium]|nr:hypothetical protein [Gammaproteobacteria bacterium]NNL03953.1 hypothetical protein [Xanthomonadales bacterium]
MMRQLVLTLILALTLQPLQAGGCAMDAAIDQSQTAVKSAMPVDDTEAGAHDCCDTADQEQDSGCGSDAFCCPCMASVSLLPVEALVTQAAPNHHGPVVAADQVTPSHSVPPFRPPIS